MTFYCYRCKKLIYNSSPELHKNFCKNRPNYNYYNSNNHNKFRYKNKRGHNYNIKNNGQISDSTKNNNIYNYRSGRRHYNHRNNYLSIKINTNRNNGINRNIYSSNRYNDLNSLKDDDFFLEYLDYTLENSNHLNNSHNINYFNNSDIIEPNMNDIYEENNFEANTRPKGVNKNILKLLPKNKVNDVNKLDEKKCIICLELFVNGDILTTIPCFHLFHPKCINEWFKNKNTCPICKTKISDEIIS